MSPLSLLPHLVVTSRFALKITVIKSKLLYASNTLSYSSPFQLKISNKFFFANPFLPQKTVFFKTQNPLNCDFPSQKAKFINNIFISVQNPSATFFLFPPISFITVTLFFPLFKFHLKTLYCSPLFSVKLSLSLSLSLYPVNNCSNRSTPRISKSKEIPLTEYIPIYSVVINFSLSSTNHTHKI